MFRWIKVLAAKATDNVYWTCIGFLVAAVMAFYYFL